MDTKVHYWVNLAEYDMVTAGAMLRTARYLYVGFMCHQTAEKMLKAAWQATHPNGIAPRVHNLERLAAEAGLLGSFTIRQRALIAELEPLNVEARYPSHKDALLKRLTKRYCTGLVGRTERFKLWIGKRL